jgi:phage tail sheath protein FI
MPQPPATPGVYVHEVPSQNKPIEGVGTSVAAFVGLAPWGPVNTPTRITSWLSFARTFGVPSSKNDRGGPFMEGAYLAHAVYGFFQNGGGTCWVVRVGPGAYGAIAQKALPNAEETQVALRLLATEEAQALTEPVSVVIAAEEPSGTGAKPSSKEPATGKEPAAGKEAAPDGSQAAEPAWKPTPAFTVEVKVGEKVEGKYEHLTIAHGPRYLLTTLNAESNLVEAVAGDGGQLGIPKPDTYTLEVPKPAGEKAQLTDLTGEATHGTGLSGLAVTDEITMVCIPDLMSLATSDANIRSVQGTLASLCEQGRRMAILDPPQGLNASQISEWQQNEETPSTAFATLYWPWLRVMHPVSGQLIEVPPCGHVAGLWARTDQTRGVYKAPANEVVMGTVELACDINDKDQEPLNRNGVNCIRGFPGRGFRTWGARTLATDSDPEWKYINVRRLFNYLTASIAQGTSWAVFEPNDEMLWSQLRIAVTNFLMGVWREGGLFGASPEEAFFVKCDGATNPLQAREAGEVHVLVGVAPVEPAEFVIFQVSQYQPVA